MSASIQSLPRTALSACHLTTSTWLSWTKFHHAEAATYRRLLDHLRPRGYSVSQRHLGVQTVWMSARSSTIGQPTAAAVGCAVGQPAGSLPLLRGG